MRVEELSKIMQDKLAEILADDVKVVSFDIFDTLLLRPVTSPQDVWQLVGKIANIPYFRDKRRVAETETRKKLAYMTEDCTLQEIYNTYSHIFGCPSEDVDSIMRLEMDVEFDLLYPRKSVQCIYNEALKKGKEIILTSDMYLPSDFLRKVLEKNGYSGYSRLYLSCEEWLTKGTGNLYARIINDYRNRGIAAGEILHVGDSYRSDLRNAKKANLHAMHINSTIEAFNARSHLKSYHSFGHGGMDNPFLVGLLANLMFDDPYCLFPNGSRYNGDASFLGYTVAPFIVSFVSWMVMEAKKDGVEQLAFAYRDGYLPEKIYDILKPFLPQFEVIRLYLSRSVRIGHPSLGSSGLYDSLSDCVYNAQMSVRDFIARRLLVSDAHEFDEVFDIFIRRGFYDPDAPIGSLDKLAHFIYELEPYFKRNAEKMVKVCDNYIHGLIDSSKKLGVFDIGYRGSVSRFLDKYYGVTNIGYNMLVRPTISLNGCQLNHTLFKSYLGISLTKVREKR